MNIDVVMLVKESMEKMGCGSAIAGELDAHSPICITFHSLPEMFVEYEDGYVTIWSKLNYTGESQLSRAAFDLLSYLMPRGSDVFVCRRPMLSIVDESLLLHGRVEGSFCANSDEFTQALEAFYEDLCAVNEILER
ncbi:InvB/SpaK family type III secretion system chaperone [Burkholderia pyrrocinia]